MSGSTSALNSLLNVTFPGLYVANVEFDATSSSASTGSYTFSQEISDQGEVRTGLADTTFSVTAVSTTPPADDPNALGTLTISEMMNGVAQPSFVVNVLGFNGNSFAVGLSPADTTSANPYQSYLEFSDNNLGVKAADNQNVQTYPQTFNAAAPVTFATPTTFDLTRLVGITYPGLNVGLLTYNAQYSAPAQQINTFSAELSNQGETRSGTQDTTFIITGATNGAPASDPNAVGTITVQETQNGGNLGGAFVLNVLGYDNNALVTGNPVSGISNGVYNTYYELSDVNIGLHASDNPNPPKFPQTFTAFNATTYSPPPCFVTGARILTTRGEIAVENLAVGDVAIAASGAERRIVWIGQRTVAPGRAAALQPVRVAAGAFADAMPNADLWLSPGHSVFVDGALIPVSFLVNGLTITQHAVRQVTYWHVELEAHDIVMSQGLPSESYLDTGNRSSFANAGTVALVPDFAPVASPLACAPLVVDGPVLTALRARLLARLADLGYAAAAHEGLSVRADGVTLPAERSGRTLTVAIPAGVTTLTLASSSGIPAHHDAAASDVRRLGVAITGLRIDGQPVALDDARLSAGFYPAEGSEQTWRWTNGRAVVSLDGAAATVEIDVMHTPLWVDYAAAAAELRLAG